MVRKAIVLFRRDRGGTVPWIDCVSNKFFFSNYIPISELWNTCKFEIVVNLQKTRFPYFIDLHAYCLLLHCINIISMLCNMQYTMTEIAVILVSAESSPLAAAELLSIIFDLEEGNIIYEDAEKKGLWFRNSQCQFFMQVYMYKVWCKIVTGRNRIDKINDVNL